MGINLPKPQNGTVLFYTVPFVTFSLNRYIILLYVYHKFVYHEGMIKKCDKCGEEYDMHPGSNDCPKCSERTFVPAEETDGKQ